MAEKTDLHDSDENTRKVDDSTVDVDVSTPSPRFWHFSQLVEGNVYIGGGNIRKINDEKDRACLLKTIEQFNVEERTWRHRETKGDHHPGLTGVACASFGKYLFAYGGNNGEDLNGVLSQLDLDTFMWSRLSPETAEGPMKKDASGMVHFGEDSLAVVCGYADPRDLSKRHGGSSDQKSTFIARNGSPNDGGGWTNEMHVFNINHKTKDDQGMWTIFSFTGSRPPPCADFSLTSVDLYRAVLYGGRRGTDEDSNDVYVIDFSEKAIMKIQPENKEDRWPKMRLGHHAARCLDFNTQNPQLLMSGGRIKHGIPPRDMWILDLATRKWKQVIADDSIQRQLERWGHTFTAITHSEGLVEVIMFGGSPGYYEVTRDVERLSFPVSFIFGLLDKEWVILDVFECNRQWTSKTSNLSPFDLGSAIMLDVLYSMERDKIPVLTELTKNKKIRSIICSETTEADLKWPTFTKPSIHKPTWENLISFLKLAKQNDLIKRIKRYLKKMKEFVLQDVEVCARRAFEITPSSTEPFEWKEYGLTLYPQKDCLPPGVDMITVTILSSIAGQYVFAEGCHLVSCVFWFRCLPNCAFSKPIKLQMEHCANTNDLTNLTFVRASTSLSPYSFKQLKGGHFFSKGDKDYGTIELSQFCGVTVAGPNERKYYASLFYLGSQIIPDKIIHITLTWNEEGHITKVKDEYVKKDAREAANQVITFDSESDSITLDIPMDGKDISRGWKLIPLVHPEITKLQMDEFKIGQGTHSFQLQILVSDPFIRREGLVYHLSLQGAKRPYNYFKIIIPAEVRKRRLWTAGNVEDAESPRKKLQRTKKSHSSLDADGYTCAASHVSNTSDDSAEEDDCIEPCRQEPVQQPQAPPPHQSKLGSTSESATAQQQNQTKFDELPTLDELLILKYTDKKGKRERVRIVSEASHKWKTIAGLICEGANRIKVLEQKCSNDPEECLRQALIENFINKKPKKYTQDWNGLIELLEDVDLETLAGRVKNALSDCDVN